MIIAEAIEAGRMVEELVEEPARPLQHIVDGPSGIQSALRFVNRHRQRSIAAPSVSHTRRVADALDEFAVPFAAAAAVVGDSELISAAEQAPQWGPDVRSGALSLSEAYGAIKSVVGDLRREQTELTLERLRES